MKKVVGRGGMNRHRSVEDRDLAEETDKAGKAAWEVG